MLLEKKREERRVREKKKRERETETETDRERERETERQTDANGDVPRLPSIEFDDVDINEFTRSVFPSHPPAPSAS